MQTIRRQSNQKQIFVLSKHDELHYKLRYEAQTRLSLGFFKRGRTMACFCAVGRTPLCSNALLRRYRTDASTSAAPITNEVGSGSSTQCLAGVFTIRSRNCSTISDWNDARCGACREDWINYGWCLMQTESWCPWGKIDYQALKHLIKLSWSRFTIHDIMPHDVIMISHNKQYTDCIVHTPP